MNKEQFFNVNLENNLLGMILNDGKILDDLIDTKDDVFYNVQNKKLFITMKVLWRDNKEINVPNIHGELKTEVNDVGGVGRLNNLLTANTGSSGGATLQNVPYGTYAVSVVAPSGYTALESYDDFVVDNEAETLDVSVDKD